MDINNLLLKKDATKTYSKIKSSLTNKYKSQTRDAKSLQKFLQAKYYGDTEKVTKLIEQTKALLDADNGRVISKNFTSFDINPAAQKVAEEDLDKNILKYYTSEKQTRNRERVSLKGIQDKLTTLINAGELFKNNNYNEIEYEKYKKQLDEILMTYLAVIKDYFSDTKSNIDFIKFADNPDIENYMKILNDFYFTYVKQVADKPSMKLIGDVFEYSMGIIAAGLEDSTVEEIYNQSGKLLTEHVVGTTGKISELNSLISDKGQIQMSLDSAPFIDNKTKKKSKKFKIELDKDFSIEVDISQLKPFDFKQSTGKQGKADVKFNIPKVTSKPLNLSLKNWANLSSQHASFESSNLGLTIAKIINNDNFYAYIFQLAQYSRGNVNDWHKVAKASLIADSLMGANQTDSYADMLVINERKNQNIIVLPFGRVAEALDSIVETDKGFNGYNGTDIEKNLSLIWEKYHAKYGGTNTILLGQTYLSKIKVELRYSSLFKNYAYDKNNN